MPATPQVVGHRDGENEHYDSRKAQEEIHTAHLLTPTTPPCS